MPTNPVPHPERLKTKRGDFTPAQLNGITTGLQTRITVLTEELADVAVVALSELERLRVNGNADNQAAIEDTEKLATIERLNATIARQKTRIDTDFLEITGLQTLMLNSQDEATRANRRAANLQEENERLQQTVLDLQARKTDSPEARRLAVVEIQGLEQAKRELLGTIQEMSEINARLIRENEELKSANAKGEGHLRLQGEGGDQAYLDLLREISELKKRADRADSFNRPIGPLGGKTDFGKLIGDGQKIVAKMTEFLRGFDG